ncbi:MAG: DedA family protein [Leptolyngbyaceae cyanobacterium SM1_4_3]|nr:DedA family protein [Leptolyngbyaceae cyanobacterium SM1_4_3]
MVEWITNTINTLGYVGIGFLMFLENLFPPIPSELIMPLAGFTAAQGEMNFFYAVLAGVIGTLLGALPWYYAGRFLGIDRLKIWADRYGKWLGISSKEMDAATKWFLKHGSKTVLLCRLVPGVRTLISIPAGTCNMPFIPFFLYSTVGTLAWVSLLTAAGYLLGDNYELVEVYMGPLSKLIVGSLLIAFIIWVVISRRKQNSKRRLR